MIIKSYSIEMSIYKTHQYLHHLQASTITYHHLHLYYLHHHHLPQNPHHFSISNYYHNHHSYHHFHHYHITLPLHHKNHDHDHDPRLSNLFTDLTWLCMSRAHQYDCTFHIYSSSFVKCCRALLDTTCLFIVYMS